MTNRVVTVATALLALAILNAGITQAQQSDREIVVWGDGVLSRPPTVLQLGITVMSIAPTAKEAAEMANARAEEVVVEFRQFGLDPGDWRIERAMIRKPLPDEPKRLAFWATATLAVRLDDFTAATDMLDRAHALKAASITMEFQIDDPRVVYESALERAVDDARRRAEVLARELNVTLGPPLGCEELSEGPRPHEQYSNSQSTDLFEEPVNARIIPDPSAFTTLNPKPIEIRARVRARFAIVR
ncbi:MAG: hypothetical protein Kow0074_09000 [Candidatus Zixiibacteriota bacterium]